ncbi:hypothetical protein HXX76_015554 [Chlamydomonas incerta]|uniref:Guanylate cyclase domain-containing protein n=1 Tax=Chlamydomonas incerta TaxID=51695 RepID=A0A835S946_CHLIN|nr:hypothetical protein HXX76_015554 [Chlamydomonas incerta]|eukprot:KAG2423038.1 hypothetical protein HXX76_015554 [Chlamydomonas incerta]
MAADHSAAARLQGADSSVLQPARLLLGLAAVGQQGSPAAGSEGGQADDALSVAAEGRWADALLAGNDGGAGTAAAPALALSAVAVAEGELFLLSLLRAHASGNTSWLAQLNASAAAGAELPAELLTPRLGSADGPAAAPLLLLYRRDWWQRLAAAGGLGSDSSSSTSGGGNGTAAEQLLPPTWDLLVQLLAALRNSDLDGDGQADHVLCADLQPGCKGWALLAAVYASVAQTHGTQQGVWFNATDLRPAVGGPAMQAALQTYAALAASNAAPFTPGGAAVSRSNVSVSPEELSRGGGGEVPADGTGPACGAVNPLFAAGRCLFTVDWATAALRLTQDRAPDTCGRLGAALLPGSGSVAPASPDPAVPAAARAAGVGASSNGSTGDGSSTGGTAAPQWPRDCTAAACPYAQEVSVPAALRGLLQGSLEATATAQPLLVNRAPLLGEGSAVWVLAPNRTLLQLVRVSEFVRRVGFQLDLKLQLLRDDNATARLCQRELQNLALALAAAPLEGAWSAPASGCAAAAPAPASAAMPPPGAVTDYGLNGSSVLSLPASSGMVGSAAAAAAAATVGGLCGGLLPLLTGASVLPSEYSALGGGSGMTQGGAAGVLARGDAAAQQQAQAVEVLGLDPSDLAAVRQALLAALRHPNAALDVQLPFSSQYRQVLDDLALAALSAAAAANATIATPAASGANPSTLLLAAEAGALATATAPPAAAATPPDGEAAAALAAVVAELAANASRQFARVAQAFPYAALAQRLYWNSIGFRPPTNNTGGGLNSSGSRSDGAGSTSAGSSQSAALRIGLPVAVAVGGALALALVGVVCYVFVIAPRGARARSKRYRAAQPPGAGPATTLVMTDVQNSTLLWEVLPQDVMDHCLSLHHRIMREAIAGNAGHEVFTEGDAFAVAFHGPDDALGFALDVQVALLEQPWPRELLQQPDAAEQWVMRRSPTAPPPQPIVLVAQPPQHAAQQAAVPLPVSLGRLPSSLGQPSSPNAATVLLLPHTAAASPSPPAPASAALLVDGASSHPAARAAATAPGSGLADELVSPVRPPQRSATQLLPPPHVLSTSGASASGSAASAWTTTVGGGSTVSGTDRGSDGSRWSAVSVAVAGGARGSAARGSDASAAAAAAASAAASAAPASAAAATGPSAGGGVGSKTGKEAGEGRRRLVRWQSEPRRSATWLHMQRQQEQQQQEHQQLQPTQTGPEKRQQSVSLTGGVVPSAGAGTAGGLTLPQPQPQAAEAEAEAMPSPFVRAQQVAVRMATAARAAAAGLGASAAGAGAMAPGSPTRQSGLVDTVAESRGDADALWQDPAPGGLPESAAAAAAAAAALVGATQPALAAAGSDSSSTATTAAEALRSASWRRRAARAAASGAAAPPEVVIEEEGDEPAAAHEDERGSCFSDAGVAAAVLQEAASGGGSSAAGAAAAAAISPAGSGREERRSGEVRSGRVPVGVGAATRSSGLSAHGSSGASSGQGRARGPKPARLPALEDAGADLDAEWQSLVTWDASPTPAAHVMLAPQQVVAFSPSGHHQPHAAPGGAATGAGAAAGAPPTAGAAASAFAGAGRALLAASRLAGQSGRRLLRSSTLPQRAALPPPQQQPHPGYEPVVEEEEAYVMGAANLLPVAASLQRPGTSTYTQADSLATALSVPRPQAAAATADAAAVAAATAGVAGGLVGRISSLLMLAPTRSVGAGSSDAGVPVPAAVPTGSSNGREGGSGGREGGGGGGSGGGGGGGIMSPMRGSRMIHSDSGRRHPGQRQQGQQQQRSHFFRAAAPSDSGATAGVLDLAAAAAAAEAPAVRRLQQGHMWAASAPPPPEHMSLAQQGALMQPWGAPGPQPAAQYGQHPPPHQHQHQHQSSLKRFLARLMSVRMPSLLRRGGSSSGPGSPHTSPGIGSPPLPDTLQSHPHQHQHPRAGTEGQLLLQSATAGAGRHQLRALPPPLAWNALEQQVHVVAALRGGGGGGGGGRRGGAAGSAGAGGAGSTGAGGVAALAPAELMSGGRVLVGGAAAGGTGSPLMSSGGAGGGGGGGGNSGGGARARASLEDMQLAAARVGSRMGLEQRQQQQQLLLQLQVQQQMQQQQQQMQMQMLSPAGSVAERPQHQLLPSSRPTAATGSGSGDGFSGRRGSPAALSARASVDREQALLLTVLRLMRPDERRQQLAQLRQQAREASFSAGSLLPPRAASVTAGMPVTGRPLAGGTRTGTAVDLPLGSADIEAGLLSPLPRPLMVGPDVIHIGSTDSDDGGGGGGNAAGSSHAAAAQPAPATGTTGLEGAGADGADEPPAGARDLISVGDLLAAAASAAGGRSAIVPGLVSQFFASLWADINSAAHEATAVLRVGVGGGSPGASLEERAPSAGRMPSFGDSQTSTSAAASCRLAGNGGGGGRGAGASGGGWLPTGLTETTDASADGHDQRVSAGGGGQRRGTSEQVVSGAAPHSGASPAASHATAGGGGLLSLAAATIGDALRPLYERLRNEDVPALLQHHQHQSQHPGGTEAGAGGGPGGGDRPSGSKTPRFMRRLSIGGLSSFAPAAAAASAAAAGPGGGATGVQQQHQGEPVLAFRGLRVRVGLHSGPRMHEVLTLVQDGMAAAAFTGDFLLAAKEVSDSAMGGMVVLSGSAFRALQQQLRSGAAGVVAQCAMLLHLGEHVIKPPQLERDSESVIGRAAAAAAGPTAQPPANLPPATRELYAAVFPALACRLALLPSPVRTHCELVPGCLSAPAGLVAPVFCNVVGVEALLAWEALVQERLMRAAAVASAAALAPCRPLDGPAGASVAGLPPLAAAPMASVLGFPGASGGSVLPFMGGAAGGSILGFGMGQPTGLMMGSPDCSGVGLVRAALEMFCDMAQAAAARHGGYVVASSADGAHWVLVFGCAEAAVGWGLDMLQAMLTAEWPDGFLEHELTEEAWEGGRLVKRGLRLRIGVDYGRAMVRLVPRSGRLDYVGRPMNRAARVAAKAKAASLLVSDAAWSAARPALGGGVSATNLGSMQLKGVKEQLELWALRIKREGEGEGGRGGGGGEGKPLSARRLRSEMTLFWIAGFETTAHAIGWTLMFIAGNPQA